MITRREFGTMTIVGFAMPRLLEGFDATVNGVRIGVQTYSFRELPRPAGAPDAVDVVIKAMKDSGVTECELFAPQLEPAQPAGRGARGAPPTPEAIKARDDLRKWRLETPLDHYKNVKKKFDAAGLTIFAYCCNMNMSFTDAELERGFEVARALGTDVMTASTTLDVAKRRRRWPTSTRSPSACTATRTSAIQTSSRPLRASPPR